MADLGARPLYLTPPDPILPLLCLWSGYSWLTQQKSHGPRATCHWEGWRRGGEQDRCPQGSSQVHWALPVGLEGCMAIPGCFSEPQLKLALDYACIFLSWKRKKWKLFSHVRFFATPWTVACQATLSMEFFRQEYWSGLPFPPLGIFPTQGSNPGLLHCRQILYCLSHQGSQ